MVDAKVTLEIVTPNGAVLREQVDDVQAPGQSGQFGVLPGHLPLLAALRTGILTLHKGAEEKSLAVGDGFVEVRDDRVLVLTDKVMAREKVDLVKARLELKEVQEQLDVYDGPPGAAQWLELVAREHWAAVQLELCGDPPIATRRPLERSGANGAKASAVETETQEDAPAPLRG